MGVRPSLLALSKNKTMHGRPWRYPPTFFVYMARDVAMSEWISLDAEKLKSQVSSPAKKFPGSCAIDCLSVNIPSIAYVRALCY